MTGGRVCLVTGAGGLLGSAFCRRYASRYHIAAVWHRRRPLLATQDQVLFDPLAPEVDLPVNQHPVFAMRADLRDRGQIEDLVSTVLDRYGRIDMLVNAAAFVEWAPLLDGVQLLETMDQAFRVNVGAPLTLATTVASRAWLGRREENTASNRCIVNVSSTAGLYVYAGHGQTVYSATKAALNILTCHMAAEFETLGVRVNALAPDAFPGRVPMVRVLDGLERLSEGDMTGRILLREQGEESWL
jgi:NAD(P)-dependent dehydrogenase (short-subunit alcohol dehydrogenase family)